MSLDGGGGKRSLRGGKPKSLSIATLYALPHQRVAFQTPTLTPNTNHFRSKPLVEAPHRFLPRRPATHARAITLIRMELYRACSKLLGPLLSKKGPGLKALAFSGKGKPPSPAVYATVSHTLRARSLLDEVLARVSKVNKVDVLKNIRDRALGYVLIYELLLGPNKSIRGGGGVKRSVVKVREGGEGRRVLW